MREARHISGRRARRRRGRAGFTLLELMVALAAGLIAITSVYFVSAASTRHFHEQQRVSQTQMSLRMAMETLRRDFARAGYLGTPSSDRENYCYRAVPRVAAIDAYVDDDPGATAALPNAGENGVAADRIVLTGNYASNDAYLAVGFDGGGSTVFLQRRWQAYRRSFGDPFAGAGSPYGFRPSDFQAVFRVGRMLHIKTLQNRHFFVRVTANNPAAGSVSFTPSLGVGGACVVGLADGAMVAPISRVEYTVVDAARTPDLAMLAPPTADANLIGATNSVLVRREVDAAGAPIPGTTRPVLEYVADFDVDFVVDDQPTPTLPPNLVRRDGALMAATVANNPERIRTLIVTLSARTAEQDPRFPFAARAAGAALTRYRVNAALPGAARVRTARAEIMMPNLAYRDM